MALKALSFEGLTYYHNKIKTLLSGKVDKEDGKGLSSNDYTTAEKTKLAGIETGADANVIETVQVNGSALSVTDKKVNVDLSAYALKSDISAVYRFKGNVATYADLPNTNQTVGDVYNVEEDGGNYAWTGETWDDLAGVVDLTEYYTKEEADGKYVALTGKQTVGGEKTFTSVVNFKKSGWNNVAFVSDSYDALDTTITGDQRPLNLTIFDKNGKGTGGLTNFLGAEYTRSYLAATTYDADGNPISANLNLYAKRDGSRYATTHTPSNSAENSDVIATTAWVNLADSVVHTTGNETIAGDKTFTGKMAMSREYPQVFVQCTKGDMTVAPESGNTSVFYLQVKDKNDVAYANLFGVTHQTNDDIVMYFGNEGRKWNGGLRVISPKDGAVYATAPATRETGYGSTDIATCGWVETKIATGGGEAITNDEIDSIFA